MGNEREKIDERFKRRRIKALENSVSFMSNSKWRKLISSFDQVEHLCTGCKWNLLGMTKTIEEKGIPNSEDVAESNLVDGQFYYVCYEDIVWLELVTEEPGVLIDHFSKIGKFKIDITEIGVKIMGYELCA